MAELRSVDPRTLVLNPDNPRRTAAPRAMDDQLVASIKAIGIIQAPRVKDEGGALTIITGGRRAKAAIAAGLAEIDVIVCDADEAADAMRSLSENLIRASMNSVDIWRATQNLEALGWNEQAVADALALPVRTVKRLKLLAHLHPAMLDLMAAGSMPGEHDLRTIAAASLEEQAQAWKKFKPKKGQDVHWPELSRALAKRRMPFTAAKFDEELAGAYGVVWEDDLFAPAGEDGRYTTNVQGFLGAQQEWMQNHLPPRGAILTVDSYGSCELPKKAERIYGKPGRGDVTGCYVDPRTGAVETVVYRMPQPKKPAKDAGPTAPDDAVIARPRPDVTQKGVAMIGDLRTDALHQALKEAEIDPIKMIGLLVLAFAGKNVSVQSGSGLGFDRETIGWSVVEAGLLTDDPDAVHRAAREMLTLVLSCREAMSASGPVARVAGEAIGASQHLPQMATEEFLSCLTKDAVGRVAVAEGLRVEPRAKDTRAAIVARFKDGRYLYPAARFALAEAEVESIRVAAARRASWRSGCSAAGRDGEGAGAEEAASVDGDGDPTEEKPEDDVTAAPEPHDAGNDDSALAEAAD